MAFALGQRVEPPEIDPNVTFHVIGALQQAVDAATLREEDATDEVIATLQAALFQSNEANLALQARLTLAERRLQVLETNNQTLQTTLQNQANAFREQIAALEERVQADAKEITVLKESEEWKKSLKAYVDAYQYQASFKRVCPDIYNKIIS